MRPKGVDDGIVPDNIRAAGAIYAAYQLEQMRLFSVADKVAEQFASGMLPIGEASSRRRLAEIIRDSASARLTETERYSLYSKVVGGSGGEVEPNREFDDLWMRFVSSVAGYQRQTNIDRNLLAQEAVRKAGRDLAVNLSQYGYPGIHTKAERVAGQIKHSMRILKSREVTAAHGTQDAWQVIDRVATSELGGAANVVRHRTLATSGQTIVRLLAKYADTWTAPSGSALIPSSRTPRSGISVTDWRSLRRAARDWMGAST